MPKYAKKYKIGLNKCYIYIWILFLYTNIILVFVKLIKIICQVSEIKSFLLSFY